MSMTPFTQPAGRGPAFTGRIKEFGAVESRVICRSTVTPSGHQHFSIWQQNGCVSIAIGAHASDASPRPGDWIVQLGAGKVVVIIIPTGNQIFAGLQQGGRVSLAGRAERSGD